MYDRNNGKAAAYRGSAPAGLCFAGGVPNPYLFCSAVAAVFGSPKNEALIFVTFYQEKVERNRMDSLNKLNTDSH
jgi:hypothetical protein